MKKGLILFAGCGGFRYGVRGFPGWEWTAVELDPNIAKIYADNFPVDNLIVGDAMEYLRDHAHEFDFIQASPPCQTHSRQRYGLGVCSQNPKQCLRHEFCDPMLWQSIIFMATHPRLKPGVKWLIENVNPYYAHLVKFAPQYRAKCGRHYVWTNADLWGYDPKMDFELPTFNVKNKNGRIANVSVKNMMATGEIWFDIQKYRGINKQQVLRNMFEPKLAAYIFSFINSEFNSVSE